MDRFHGSGSSIRCIVRTALILACAFGADLSARAAPFAIVALPDTQNYNKKPNPNLLDSQVDWIVANRAQLNIAFVSQLGDFTDDGSNADYWTRATAAIDKLSGVVPYCVSLGNHDLRGKVGGDSSRAFSTRAHQGGEAFGGASPDGLSFFQVFSADRFKLLHVSLCYDPSAEALAWAGGVLKDHPSLPVIVTTHRYLNIDGNLSPEDNPLWNTLVDKNPRIFMVLCGHFHGEAQRLATSASGARVIQMLADYQSDPNGGNGFLRQILFKPEEGRIEIKSYSTSLKTFRTGLNSEFAFDAAFDAANNAIRVVGQTGLSPETITPRLTKKPAAKMSLKEGAAATFGAAAAGTPPLAFQWTKNGADIPGATSDTYTTPPLAGNDDKAGFAVRVSNAAGSVVCKPCVVSLAAPKAATK
jgi:3',5'-cyclic AMP phosphodiesterase CpdA